MLKAKKMANYRRGNKSTKCSHCTNFVPAYRVIGIGGIDMGISQRCKKIGLQPGRMYCVTVDHVCDHFADRYATVR